MDITLIDDALDPVVYAVAISADESALLSRTAWARMARILRVEEDVVREKAEAMLTPAEITRFERESIMACAAAQAMDAVGRTYMITPEVEPYEPHAHDAGQSEAEPETRNGTAPTTQYGPLRFTVRVHPVPAMELDLKTPVGHSVEESDEERVTRALRARLHGTIPEALLRTTLAMKQEAFDQELAEAGITYREYRIENNLKPQDVQDALYDEAFDELSEDIAFDLVFLRLGLEIKPDNIQAALASIAPDQRENFTRDLKETGRECLLHQKARRHAALRWAVENLME